MVDELIEPSLLHGKELLDDTIVSLKDFLCSKRVEDLRKIAVNISIQLTGAMQKMTLSRDWLEQLKQEWHAKPVCDDDDSEVLAFEYIILVKRVLNDLSAFSSIVQWGKHLKGVLNDFTFMNLLIYLVYGKSKSFDVQPLKAFKS